MLSKWLVQELDASNILPTQVDQHDIWSYILHQRHGFCSGSGLVGCNVAGSLQASAQPVAEQTVTVNNPDTNFGGGVR
jgi:hypothetical protein